MRPVKQDVVNTKFGEILVRSWCISPIRVAALPGVEDLILLRDAVRHDEEKAVVLHDALYRLACSPCGRDTKWLAEASSRGSGVYVDCEEDVS